MCSRQSEKLKKQINKATIRHSPQMMITYDTWVGRQVVVGMWVGRVGCGVKVMVCR